MSLWDKLLRRSSQKSGSANKVELPVKKRKRRRLPKRLTREEVNLLLAQPDVTRWRGLRDRCILELMYRAGLRVSEVVVLLPRDIEVDRNQNGVVHVWDGKGGVDRTSYFDPTVVMPYLNDWIGIRAKQGFTDEQPLFCAARGKELTTRSVQLMVARHKKSAGIESVCTPHVLRHTFASELIEEGFATREIQELLGHASVATTEVYTHVAPARLAAKVRDRRAVE